MNKVGIENLAIELRISEFIQYKRNMGYAYNGSIIYQLDDIKRLLIEYNQSETNPALTKEAVLYVLSKKERYQKQAYASLLREYARYLDKIGEQAYILSKKQFPIMKRNFKPYIYSRDEIQSLMETVDNYSKYHDNLSDELKVILPFIMRLIYSCGLRVSEALNLGNDDINLKEGSIYIYDSKENRSRYVPLSDSMIKVLMTYENRIKEGTYYFEIREGAHVSKEVLYYHFKKINKIMFPKKSKTKLPTIHDLRHTAAVHMLEKMDEACLDLNENIFLITVFLGHASIKETEVYLHLPRYRYNDISNLDHINQIFPAGGEEDGI